MRSKLAGRPVSHKSVRVCAGSFSGRRAARAAAERKERAVEIREDDRDPFARPHHRKIWHASVPGNGLSSNYSGLSWRRARCLRRAPVRRGARGRAAGGTGARGCSFNVAFHLRAFGASPLLVTRIGRDADGRRLVAAMRRRGLDVRGVQRDGRRSTARVVVGPERTARASSSRMTRLSTRSTPRPPGPP